MMSRLVKERWRGASGGVQEEAARASESRPGDQAMMITTTNRQRRLWQNRDDNGSSNSDDECTGLDNDVVRAFRTTDSTASVGICKAGKR